MSFFLSCLAFHKFGRHGKKLIINFDNHQDYSGSDPVWYDKWGAGFFQHAETLSDLFTPERVVYTILGETKMEVSKPAVRGSVKQLYYSNRTRAGAEADSSHPLGTVEFRTDPTPFVNGRRTTASWILRHDGRELASGVQDADIEELCIEKILERPASALKDLTDHLFKVRTGPHVTTGLREKNRPLVTKLNETGAPTIDGRRKPDYWILKHDGFELASPIEDVDIQELCDKGVLARPASAFKDLKDYLFELQPGPHDRTGLREKNGPLVTRLNEIDAAIIDLTTCAGDAMLKSEYITDLSDTDVYITVDRDVSQKSFTYWGDGYLTSAQMRSAVERCLGFLKSKGANLVGFDIAGLPDSAGKSAVLGIKRGNVGAHKAEICQQAKDDIEFFLSKVMAYGPID
jgi:hypothetical protein